MIKLTLFIYMLPSILWKGIACDNCIWTDLQQDVSPPKTEEKLVSHRNWNLIPQGRCGRHYIPPNAPRIFAGADVRNAYMYPWMAKVSFGGENLEDTEGRSINCGGSIINERYILTAAHCCKDMAVGRSLWYLGSNYLAESHMTVGVEKIIIHEKYDRCKGDNTPNAQIISKNDICLTRIDRKIDFIDDANDFKIHPICLPAECGSPTECGTETQKGVEMEALGFGQLHPNFTSPPRDFRLQSTVVKLVPQDECRRRVSSAIDAREICVTPGPCRGDSGGPLMKKDPAHLYHDIYHLYGVLSQAFTDCRTGVAVAMRVTEYVEWILDSIEP